jgi:hypothetical protein
MKKLILVALISIYTTVFLCNNFCYAEVSKEEAMVTAKQFFEKELTKWGPIGKTAFTIGDAAVHDPKSGEDYWCISFRDPEEKNYESGGSIYVNKNSGKAKFIGYFK